MTAKDILTEFQAKANILVDAYGKMAEKVQLGDNKEIAIESFFNDNYPRFNESLSKVAKDLTHNAIMSDVKDSAALILGISKIKASAVLKLLRIINGLSY